MKHIKRSFQSLVTENQDLFPTAWSFPIFLTYMALFVSQGLLVTASRRGDTSYPFNPTTVVLVTEILKLIISSSVFIYKNSLFSIFHDLRKNWVVGAYYMVPASLYCLYNNLAFTNLANFDPTTYFVFMQIRLLMTGVIYQCLFKRSLSGKQWLSLVILTLGCLLQGLNVNGKGEEEAQKSSEEAKVQDSTSWWALVEASTAVFLILLQVCCSVFAGVYNEYIIKNVGSEVDIMLQNVYMYVDSILCNLAVLIWQGQLWSTDSGQGFFSNFQVLFQFFVIAIIINNSLVGIVTSLFLKNLNSILKAFASALELILTAIFSWILLGIPIYWNTILAVCIVGYSVVMYAKNPLKSSEDASLKYHLDAGAKKSDTKINLKKSKKIQENGESEEEEDLIYNV